MITQNIQLTKLIASEGHTLTNGEAFGQEIYLGVNDSVENWYEITTEEAEAIQKQREEAVLNESK